jgi:uncharacterized damage-inducible protein DinB
MLKKYLLQNLAINRKRSLLTWHAFPEDKFFWKPDAGAMHLLEMVRHIFEAEYWFHGLIVNRGDVTKITMPEKNEHDTNLDEEIGKGEKYDKLLTGFINDCTEEDFENIIIRRTDKDFVMKLGDFLLRAAYHEATHTGQLLGYLRTLNIPRPHIWDVY